uniref:non-specific serine/threonine protein kinase n=1 Tax=Peromyscus maniculatus bairdii TaxID=230844 RepID=A0A8C8UMR5_PERMB
MDCHPNTKSLNSQYMVLFPIGHGAFGSVQLAYHRLTGIPVAIKVIENLEEDLRFIVSEMVALERLHHPNIIRLFQVLVTQEQIYFITEFAPGGDLFQRVTEEGRLQEEEGQKIFGQILSAIKYCHDLDIVHRDLKPENILFDEEGNVKLADLGLATSCRPGTLLHQQCVTKSFNAPEQVLGLGYDGKKTDVWSLGVLLYLVTTGNHPFQGDTMEEIEWKIITGTYDIPAHVSGQLENLIHQMLTVAPERKPSIEDLQQDPWNQGLLLQIMLLLRGSKDTSPAHVQQQSGSRERDRMKSPRNWACRFERVHMCFAFYFLCLFIEISEIYIFFFCVCVWSNGMTRCISTPAGLSPAT